MRAAPGDKTAIAVEAIDAAVVAHGVPDARMAKRAPAAVAHHAMLIGDDDLR
jgi:hypothetical protein